MSIRIALLLNIIKLKDLQAILAVFVGYYNFTCIFR